VIVRVPDQFFPEDEHLAEIQIRTRRQDLWAQIVERVDKDLDWDLKHGEGPAEWLEWLHDLSDRAPQGGSRGDLGHPAVAI